MAVLIATVNGILTDAGTWGVVDATAHLDSEAANTVLTTAYVESAAFTPGAITIDGIAVKVASRAAVPSGTMSIRLAQAGATVAGTEVTINVSDLPSRDVGWVFFKFAAPVLLVVATPYTVSAKTSVITQVNLYRNATAGNWSRMLRTTTTAAPGAGDDMYVLGEWTAATVKTDRTVTMDSAAATDYGSGSLTLAGFGISKGGIVTWGTTAATNYILRLSTLLVIYNGGVMNMGTTGTPCPRDSTMLLEFDSGADGDFGLKIFGTFNAQGLSRSSGKNIVRCLLNTDEAAAQTILGVDTDTGWLSGDEIAIASTTRTASQAETRVLNGNAGATTVTVTVGLTNAHSGTSPTQAEVVLLTRAVRIQSVSSTFMAYVYFGVAAIVDCDWASFRYMGTSSTVGKRGMEVDTASGSIAFSFCSLRDFDFHGIYCAAADWNNLSIDNLTGYKVGSQTTAHAAIRLGATTGTNWSLTNIDIVAGNTAQGYGVYALNGAGTMTNIRCNSGGYGVNVELDVDESIDGTWSGFELHSNVEAGMRVVSLASGKVSNLNAWRNNGTSASTGAIAVGEINGRFAVVGGSFFGNTTNNVSTLTGSGIRRFILRNITIAADTTFAVTNGINLSATGFPFYLTLENCTLGVVSGIFAAHTNDIQCNAVDRYAEFIFINSLLASATEIANSASLRGRSFIGYQRVDQATNTHRRVYPALGTVSYETTTFRTASPSEKLAPSAATAGQRLETGVKRVAVNSGGTVTIGAYVRKNGAYVGSAPRLIVRANPALGIDDDVVLDSLSVAADTWEQLTGTSSPVAEEDGVLEFVVDCDGAAGEVYVDDWSAA